MNTSESPSDSFVVLVERLAETRGVTLAPDGARELGRAERELGGPTEAVWQERLEHALASFGVEPRATCLSIAEVTAVLRAGQPAVCFRRSADNPDGWTLLLDGGSGRIFVADLSGAGADRWLTPEALAAELDCAAGDRLPWLLCDAVLPATGATAHRHHGASVGPARRLWQIVRPDRPDLWSIVVFGIVVGTFSLATPIAVQQLVNSVALGGLLQPVVVLALLLLVGLAFAAGLTAIQAFVAEIVQRRIFVRVVADLARRIPRVRVHAFDGRHGPEVVNRFFDVLTVQKVGTTLLLDGVGLTLQTLMGLLLLSFYHPLMLGFSVLLLAGIAFVVVVLGRGAVPTAVAESQSKYAVEAWFEEVARRLPEFKTEGAGRLAVERADALAREYLRARSAHYRIVFRQLAGALGLQVVASSAILGLGGGLVIAGQLTLGQLVASELVVTAIVASFAKLGKHLESYYDLMAAVDKLGILFDLPLERDEGALVETSTEAAAVSLRGVRFSYGDRTVLDQFDLDVAPGERVVLIGPSGAGKSTLFDLILGLRTPASGYVTVDDADLRHLRLDSLRERIVRVRGPEVVEGSIEDNVRMGRRWISTKTVREALARVGLLEAARSLPDGLETKLTADGSPLSRSESLRLTLARAIAGRPSLLLLEDALHGLDEECRSAVEAALFGPEATWTLLAADSGSDLNARCDRVVELPTIRRPRHAAAHVGNVPPLMGAAPAGATS